ncbi:ABC-type antimicrobial peptide transport system, permease component [Chryseolinea serpens]|uniref:ABC-type antimicrobial peptide transport system, permease component n=1 Tax=Chryseolinea serpens TaxID=947013 RepID=A0A1M5RUJ6_9BACT|nr:ABC transporter permease [Chryseolinea serpens]SHH29839.1 ABC-type antimicrobial peptide transport system, permease component [Chryseolinea serpens]
MLRNYLVIAWRSLQKSRVYSFINIAGLSIGLACSMFIFLWVADERSWDNFHEKKSELNRVYINWLGDRGVQTQMAVNLPLWEELKHDRDIVHVAPTDWGREFLLTYGEKRLYRTGYYAGDDFLKMFSFPVVQGSAENQLKDPSTMVITESTAKALFGDEDPIGKMIRVDDRGELTVTGVTKDVPTNSTFQFQCLLPFSTYAIREPWTKEAMTQWSNNSFNLYVEFAKGAEAQAIESRSKDIIKKHRENSTQEVTFLPMERWRLFGEFENGKSTTGTIVYVRMFTIIALFILVIACINFMNLATARSERRAREVGIRKSIGSKRKDLVVQFLGETFFITILAFILAVGLVESLLPLYNDLVDKKLFIDFTNPLLWLVSVGVIAMTGFISGSYPALYLSSFQPAAVLKGKMQMGKSGTTPRRMMVTLQFFFSIVLIFSTMVIYKQLNHLRNRPTGYDGARLVTIGSVGDIPKNYNTIKQELLASGLAENVMRSSSPITAIYGFKEVGWAGKREDQRSSFAIIGTDYDYTKTLGVKMLQGRDYSDAYNDSSSIILNQTAVEYIGLKNPIGETLTIDDHKFTVIGVTENVIMNSPQRQIDPTVLVFDPNWMSDVTLRLPENKNTQEALAGVEAIFKKYNPSYPFTFRFTEDEFNRKFTNIQRVGRLANLFAGLAILISCLGLFGLAAFTAEQRTKEIGIRKVLGATVSSVVVLLSKEFTRLIILAFVLAAPLAWWAMNQWLQEYDYRISIPWWIVASAGGLAFVLAVATVSFQAVKAAVANPVKSLRNE